MAVTKRIGEMVVQTLNAKYNTLYASVRFGNVLGSNGSVIPIFEKQIRQGGPVTVTHRDMARYFTSIPGAVNLILQCGAFLKGGEIFTLDSGKPVKIYDLAEKMIKLMGFTPNKDVEIKIAGLRPGETLVEVKPLEEGLKDTLNPKIFITKPIAVDEDTLFDKIKALNEESYNETDKMLDLICELVPSYKAN
jgi:FlaA1/EpsC-like NDP-sugar epimerase